jgi:hypothetical protein
MRSAISREDTEKKADDENLSFALAPFSVDLQGLDDLGYPF